jgi:hypothetical protein
MPDRPSIFWWGCAEAAPLSQEIPFGVNRALYPSQAEGLMFWFRWKEIARIIPFFDRMR